MKELELEKTYLAKRLPEGLEKCKCKEVFDSYIPASSHHPVLRIRKNGEKMMITKKQPRVEGDASAQDEHTIPLTSEEFTALSKLEGKKVRKMRYYYPFEGRVAEVDVFQDALKGLVLVDFEFATEEEKNAFQMPEFCLADVTQETFLAGGMVCGKSYVDIEGQLAEYGYAKL